MAGDNAARDRIRTQLVRLFGDAMPDEARVESPASLPELVGGKEHEFDLVAIHGAPPLGVRTVVEIHTLKTKVSAPRFEKWCDKRNAVGAHYLVCVSTSGYSKNVLDLAEGQALTLRLLEPADVERGLTGWGYPMVPFPIAWDRPLATRVGLDADGDGVPGDLDLNETRFECGDPPRPLSLDEVRKRALAAAPPLPPPPPGSSRATVRGAWTPDEPLAVVHRDGRYPVRAVTVEREVQRESHALPFDPSTYRRAEENGEVVWTATARLALDQGPVEVHASFVVEADGLRLGPLEFRGIPPDAQVNYRLAPGPQ